MYNEFYGLRDIPFSLTPDPRFLYFTASHREVMANLHYGIQHGKGLIVATGEVGTGKTTMLRAMLARLDRSVLTSYIFNPGLEVPEFYHYIATSFGIPEYVSKSDLLMKLGRLLMTRHARGLRSVLIVDEAQGLSKELLEEIRLLLNFETYTEKQIQIILAGQPELRKVLNDPGLRQLKQRISLRCEIKPLRADEVGVYIRARLKTAGATRLDLFPADAVAAIFRASEGVPRLINNICDNALLNGFAVGAQQITTKIINEVIEDLDLIRPSLEADENDALVGNALPARSIIRDESREDWRKFEHRQRPRAAEPTPLRPARPVVSPRPEVLQPKNRSVASTEGGAASPEAAAASAAAPASPAPNASSEFEGVASETEKSA